jgi:flavin reductase (DIM6/NTAB) family NADH-FMN oxidoreductase RutF
MTAIKSTFVNAPIIDEFPVTLECELQDVINTDSMYAIVGKIVNVCAEERVLNDKGKIDVAKLNALIFDQFTAGYYVTGERVGQAWVEGRELLPKE